MGLFRFIDNLATFYTSDINEQTGKGFLETMRDTGNYGEMLSYNALFWTPGNREYLHNCYVPTNKGFSEIDLIMVHDTGLYVVESKNYSGWIFGDENQRQWTQVLSGGKTKNRFYNPILQNKRHIEALKNFFADYKDIPIYSLIVFSERCELKKVTYTAADTYVVKRDRLPAVFRKQLADRESFAEDKMIDIYQRLLPFCKKSDEEKQAHIDRISALKVSQTPKIKTADGSVKQEKATFDKVDAAAKVASGESAKQEANKPDKSLAEGLGACPRCGEQLVQRNGKNGRFVGCSGFPRCRYTANLPDSMRCDPKE